MSITLKTTSNDHAIRVWRRFTVFVIGITSLSSLHAQQVTVEAHHKKLTEVLEQVKSKTNVRFFYNKSIGIEKQYVDVSINDEPIEIALDKIFAVLPYSYRIINNTIVITKKNYNIYKDPSVAHIVKRKEQAIVNSVLKGRVVDLQGHGIEDVLLTDNSSGDYTYTDSNGDFTMNVGFTGMLTLSHYGYKDQDFPFDKSHFNYITINNEPLSLADVRVKSIIPKLDRTKFVDLTNRSYMNLGQVLQGTIPGLSLQTSSTSSKTILSIDVAGHDSQGSTFTNMTVEQFLKENPTNGQQILDALLSGIIPSWLNSKKYILHTTNTITNTVVPQIRGSNTFASNTAGMLVVIDGFPRDGFPADYPMANVESIEVVKDPQELLKWGSKAAGGLILIKTKSAHNGGISVNYTSNYYYQPAPRYNRAKQQLASVPDYLDYIRVSDSLYPRTTTTSDFNISPAYRLLMAKNNGSITAATFENSWDSLKLLDNSEQLRLLQQNSFSMNHNLSIVGGTHQFRYNYMGGYATNQGNELNAITKRTTVNLNNSFNLLNDKLTIDWLLNYTNTYNRTGPSVDPNNLQSEPYQMLLDKDGNYLYDNTTLGTSGNNLIMSKGYYNYGVNLLEDARNTKSSINSKLFQSRFNMKWELLPNLVLNTSFLYKDQNTDTKNLYGKETSTVRQKIDQYGQMNTLGTVDFYIPYGDIFQLNTRKQKDWNLRTALSYHKVIGKHDIQIGVGAGAASSNGIQPSTAVLYGYNANTGKGLPIFLPTPDPKANITNFYTLFRGVSSANNPYALTIPTNGDTTRSRNMNWNANLRYQFMDRITLKGFYSNVLNPIRGQDKNYSNLINYNSSLNGLLYKGNNDNFLQKLSVTVGTNGFIMPNLPVQYLNSRYLQSLWGNYTIWVSGLTPTQQNGQKSINYYEKMTASLAGGKYQISVGYNTQKMTAILGKQDSAQNINYLSAELKTFLRNGNLIGDISLNKSPEGNTQVNGAIHYDISKEPFFKSKSIGAFTLDLIMQNISAYQGLTTMMNTNIETEDGAGFTMATNNSFTSLPPKNTNYEVRLYMATKNDKYALDLRYYNHTTSGLTNSILLPTDATTGLSNQVAYSNITNKGVEFFLKSNLIQKEKFRYSVTLNGAYNLNIANNVPKVNFSVNNSYQNVYRNGYSTSNLWSYRWAGLDNAGNPQIYNAQGNITSQLDDTTLANSMVYSGVTQAPWNGGLIHEIRLNDFFARVTMTFSLGAVMRRYIPTPSNTSNKSILIKDRWQKAGDELHTDVPAISLSGEGTARAFVTQNSTNSLMSANNVRLQEVMLGWSARQNMVKRIGLKSLTLTAQIENAALWTKNKLHVDPNTVGVDGRVSLPLPKQYGCSLIAGF